MSQQHPITADHRTEEQTRWRVYANAFQKVNWLGWATLIVTAAAAIAAFYAYKETKRQADIAQKALDEVKSGSAQSERAVIAAEQSAKASASLVEESHKQAVQELRPYVWIRLSDVPVIEADGSVSIRRRFSNTGKTVALNAQRVTHIDVLPFLPSGGSGLPYPSDQEVAAAAGVDFIAPGSERTIFSFGGESSISLEKRNALLAHNGFRLVEWGTVRYQDVFGQMHHLWFCSTWDGENDETQHCPRGNRID